MVDAQDYKLFDDDHGCGRVFIPHTQWCPRFSQIVREEGIVAVRLSDSAGWNAEYPLDFLSEFQDLKSLEVYSWSVRDLSIVSELKSLEVFGSQCDIKVPIKLSGLHRLRVLKATLNKAFVDLTECRNIEHLSVSSYPYSDITVLTQIRRLDTLAIVSRKLCSLMGLEKMPHLRVLDLYSCPSLSDWEALNKCSQLEEVQIASCKRLNELDCLGSLTDLKKLYLDSCGKIKSLAPILNLKRLELLSFIESTIEDGVTSTLTRVKSLKRLMFTPRRHYDAKRKDIEEALGI